MIDSTQADWKERADMAAYLSNELPLQICLRIPFTSASSMSYITRRCTVLIVEYYRDSAKAWPKIDQDRSRRGLNELEMSSLADFLKDAPEDQIRVLYVDGSCPPSYYPMWTIYEEYMQGRSVSSLALHPLPYSVTTIGFSTEEYGREQSFIPLQFSQI